MSLTAAQNAHNLNQAQSLDQKNEVQGSSARQILCALAIIAGLGCLAAGLCAYYQVGALSTLSQVYSFVLMGAGGFLVIVGILLGCCKTPSKVDETRNKEAQEEKDREALAKAEAKFKANLDEAVQLQEKIQKDREALAKLEEAQKELEALEKVEAEAKKQEEKKRAKDEADAKAAQILAEAKAKADKKAAEEKAKKEKIALETTLFPSIHDVKLPPGNPLLQIDTFGMNPLDMELLNMPLQVLVDPDIDKWGMFASLDIALLSDPKRKAFVEAIHQRLEAFDRTIQLVARVRRMTKIDHSLKVGMLTAPLDTGILRFKVMTDYELSQLKVSDIKPERDDKVLWNAICPRLRAIGTTDDPLPKLTPQNIPDLLLTDLIKLKADQMETYAHHFPAIAFLLIDFQEFEKLDLVNVRKTNEIIDYLFDGPYGDREKSKAAILLNSCAPQTVYKLSFYFPKMVWSLLDPPLLAELEFLQVLALKDDNERKGIIEEIFSGPYGDGKKCRAARRLQSMQKREIAIIKPYLPQPVLQFIT